ncbi:hypothetical protein MPTK1_1g08650 [Marchantia polymorpha subsp. ruderalis]|uniref:Uncharacterized protein n=2 Tax=Marchantia polymorpha TaxID=3197 RepID=A0AAF6AN05_MARPO|nr:hypothetical protein MARPO_0036s0108 [Marchantia polymorpha]BBM97825.1 hypothetical protein Mp_1g08650 [Marchantia polymorpha subsp. ruderalis]|eukprot:PTQ41128.1 hypothetical protein MARPO_0036s0108 [Marchantia polymorpha]
MIWDWSITRRTKPKDVKQNQTANHFSATTSDLKGDKNCQMHTCVLSKQPLYEWKSFLSKAARGYPTVGNGTYHSCQIILANYIIYIIQK